MEQKITNDEGHSEGATAGTDTSGLLQLNLVRPQDRDAVELESIAQAYNKHIYRARRKKSNGEWFTEEFIRKVHFDMFGNIWDWAGKYRNSLTNIGVEPYQIPEQIGRIIGDFKYWNSPESKMPMLETVQSLPMGLQLRLLG